MTDKTDSTEQEHRPTLFGDAPPRQLRASFTMDEIARWNMIWPQAVAMAWADDQVKKDLLEHPRQALATHLGYTFPGEIDLHIADATGFEGVTRNGVETTAGYRPSAPTKVGHWLVPATRVQVWLPPKPEDEELQAVALAAYGTRGHIYPFTCCG